MPCMGITHLAIEVGNASNPTETVEVKCIVDSGLTYSVIPRAILKGLGIEPITREEYRLANGERIEREKGVAIFKYAGRTGGADVIFGEEGDETLLGAFTLEAIGLSLDPLRRELKPIPLLL